MEDINIREIISLSAEEIDNPDDKIKKVFEWNYERNSLIVKGVVGFSLSLIITLLFSFFKNEIKVDLYYLIIPICFSILTGSYGFYKLYQIKRLGRQYIAAIKLISEFKKISPFISLYKRNLG